MVVESSNNNNNSNNNYNNKSFMFSIEEKKTGQMINDSKFDHRLPDA